jgi:ABC-type multidrug transport system fused ATPase/permease subunit
VRYQEDLPDVLHHINLEIKVRLFPQTCLGAVLTEIASLLKGGQRISIVGSTGSGKSTFALALFRAIESHQGSISIDGIGM